MNGHEDNAKTISPELMARIEALEDEGLRADLLRLFSSPGRRTATNEEIFENKVASWNRVKLQRATLYRWHVDEMLAFVEHFRREMPQDYAEYLRQERECNEIESDLSWRIDRLACSWIPNLGFGDITNLFGMVRAHFRAQLKG
jgi:hypothetical protein